MQKHEDNLATQVDGAGLVPMPGVTVTVIDQSTGLAAALYSDNGVTPITMPIVTDNTGYYGFFAADGRYTITFTNPRIVTFTRDVILEDPKDNPYATLAQLAAPTGSTNIGNGTETVADSLNALQLADYTALRAYAGPRKSVYVTGYLGTAAPSGIAGMFVRDDSDTTTADNGGTVIVDAAARRWKRNYSWAVDPRWFGANNGGAIDTTSTIDAVQASAVKAVDFAPGTYKVNVFHTNQNTVYRGIGNPVIAFNFVSATAWLNFQSGSRYDGIVFQSNEPNLPWQRGAIEGVSKVTLRNCGLFGFRDTSSAPNAWGLSISNSSDIVIDCCEFGSNSQSDIAITDSVRDVTIINARNTTDNGVSLNIEPNGPDGVDGLNVIGGHYRTVYLQENDNHGYAGRNIVLDGARIDMLYYDGAGATLKRCDLAGITNSPDGVGAVYAGALMIENCDLGPNLIPDPYFFDVSTTDANSAWAVYTSGTAPYYNRVNDSTHGKFLRANPNKTSGDYYPTSRVNIPVTAGEKLFFFIRSRCDNTSTPTVMFPTPVFVQWKDSSGTTTISTTNIKTCRGAAGSFTDWTNDIAVLVPPAGAVSAKIYVGATGAVFVDVASVGLFRPYFRRSGMGNMPEVIGRLSRPNLEREFLHTRVPAGSAQWPGYFVNERIINSIPTVGQPKAWICTAAGTGGASGTWTSEGNL